MGCCSAPNCCNKNSAGYRLFRFPSDICRRAIWLQNCRRDNWNPTSTARLCEVKESDDFPKQICLNCLSNLDTSYELYTQCLEAQSVIKNMMVNRQNEGEVVKVYLKEEVTEDTSNTGTVPSATVKMEDIYVEEHVIEYSEEISLEDMFGEKFSPSEVAAPALQQFEQPLPPHPPKDTLSELSTENIMDPEEQEPDPQNICHICGRELSDAWNLKRHYLVHTQERPHKCGLCGRGFNQLTHLKAHISTHEERQALQCGECGKVFSLSRNFRRHILTHSPMKPHICPVCNKGFVQASDLKAHSLTHLGGALPHVCTVCGKGFARPYHLRTHATIHTGEKPHVCKVCGKRFRDSGFLRKHIRIHAPNRIVHACTICGKTFSQSSCLKKHSLLHSRVA